MWDRLSGKLFGGLISAVSSTKRTAAEKPFDWFAARIIQKRDNRRADANPIQTVVMRQRTKAARELGVDIGDGRSVCAGYRSNVVWG